MVRPRFELAGGVEDHPVADHDGVDIALAHQVGQHPGRHLDRNAPVDQRPTGTVGLGAVDHHDVLGPSGAHTGRGSRLVVGEQPGECQCGEVLLLLDRVTGAGVWRGLGEQGLHRPIDTG